VGAGSSRKQSLSQIKERRGLLSILIDPWAGDKLRKVARAGRDGLRKLDYENLGIEPLESRQMLTTGVFTNVPEAAGYSLVYELPIANTVNYNTTAPAYTVNNSANFAPGSYDRIAYYLELQTGAGSLEYVYASMDQFTTDVTKIGIPRTGTNEVFQRFVTNMNVASNKAGIVTGTGFQTGNIEFWNSN
jgi:hypothetical protein